METEFQIKECFFTKNIAEDMGGALYILDSGNIMINSTVFYGNKAKNGGAIYFFNDGLYLKVFLFLIIKNRCRTQSYYREQYVY